MSAFFCKCNTKSMRPCVFEPEASSKPKYLSPGKNLHGDKHFSDQLNKGLLVKQKSVCHSILSTEDQPAYCLSNGVCVCVSIQTKAIWKFKASVNMKWIVLKGYSSSVDLSRTLCSRKTCCLCPVTSLHSWSWRREGLSSFSW